MGHGRPVKHFKIRFSKTFKYATSCKNSCKSDALEPTSRTKMVSTPLAEKNQDLRSGLKPVEEPGTERVQTVSAQPSGCPAGTHQFRDDALLGPGPHLRNASLQLRLDVALLSSSETDCRDTLGNERNVHPPVRPPVPFFNVSRVHCQPGAVSGTGYRDEQNRWGLCPHGV